MQIDRHLRPHILEWLKQQMVFVGGPRQVGKAFLSKTFIKSDKAYLSWDDLGDRALLKEGAFVLKISWLATS